ncbi:MAG: hypothetical protein ACE5IR_09510 [bacterium]
MPQELRNPTKRTAPANNFIEKVLKINGLTRHPAMLMQGGVKSVLDLSKVLYPRITAEEQELLLYSLIEIYDLSAEIARVNSDVNLAKQRDELN